MQYSFRMSGGCSPGTLFLRRTQIGARDGKHPVRELHGKIDEPKEHPVFECGAQSLEQYRRLHRHSASYRSVVAPIRTSSPSHRRCAVMRTPLTNVPLRLLASQIVCR